MAQLVKNLPSMQETWVRSLGWEDPLEKGKATHSSILARRIPYSPWGCKESDTTEQLSPSFILDFGGCLVVFMNMVYRWICCLKVDLGKRELLPTRVFWPECGLFSPWGHKKSDTTE